jgi:hypothetical protein
MVHSQAERMIILEHYFASKSSSVVREIFINAFPDKEVMNKTTIQRRVTKVRDTSSTCVSSRRSWTFTVKLFCNFLRNTIYKTTRLSSRSHRSLQKAAISAAFEMEHAV